MNKRKKKKSYFIIVIILLILFMSLVKWDNFFPSGPKIGVVDINMPIMDSKKMKRIN